MALILRPVALSIAGSDSSGGAGVVADLKTFEALGVWGTVAITAVTAQNTLGVAAIHLVPVDMVRAQIEAVAGDLGVAAAKSGMLGSAAGVRAAARAIRDTGIGLLVVDPVLLSTHGDVLLAVDALDALRSELLPLATVVTPNLAEASALVGWAVEDRAAMVEAAQGLRRMGASCVLLKGGHLADQVSSPDLFCGPEGMQWLDGPRLPSAHTHGTGCVLSAAIAAHLAQGASPISACHQAKQFVTRAIRAGGPRGRGIGPVDPGAAGGARS